MTCNRFFQEFIVCLRLLREIGAARTPSEGSRMFKFRADRNWITLVGRWLLPGRKKAEYYWSRSPMAARYVAHQAGLANACAPYFPYAEFSSPILRVGAEDLIPDKCMTMGGVRYFIEYDNHGQETQKFLAKKLALYRAHFCSLDAEELKRTSLLFITSCAERRAANLIQSTKEIPNVSATTLAQLRADPTGEIWSVCESDQKLALCVPSLESKPAEFAQEMDVNAEIASVSAR